ncbi:MAG TPA: PDZ domain-containing protein [Pyrinomonadaceae bacterium]
MLRLMISCVVLLLTLTICRAQTGPMPLQSPAVSRSQIAFVYAGSVWMVDRAGGDARRLTSAAGDEAAPAFSPDGSQVAFTKNVGGNFDVYVMPAVGGEMRRLTYHPKPDFVTGWTPDGKSVLFSSLRTSDAFSRLYRIPAAGGFETDLPFPMGVAVALSPDGARAALAQRRAPQSWRNYRGGSASPIQIVRLDDSQIEATLPRVDSNDSAPMWLGGGIYFISDRTGTANLFVYDVATKKVNQLTKFEKTDVKAAAATEDAIVFTQGGQLQLFDLKSSQARVVPVRVAGEFAETQPRSVKAARWIRSFNLSPTGTEVVFGARGEILALNVEKNEARNLTQTPGVAERFPAYSPDGKSIAYFSDESGEYELHIRPTSGEAATRKISIERNPSFYSEPVWSPDSKKVAFSDKRLSLWYVDIERGAARKVDTSSFAGQGNFAVAWSPDSRWLAYAKFLATRQRGLFLYSLDTGTATTVSANRLDADSPAFDRSGKYLYFLSSVNAGPGRAFGMSAFPFTPVITSNVNIVVLRADEPSPALPPPPRNENEPQSSAAVAFRIDLENIGGRVLPLPGPPLDYTTLAAGRAGVIFAAANDWSNFTGGDGPPQTLYKLDLNNRKSDKFLEGITNAAISDDGSRLAYQKRGNWLVVGTDSQPKPDEGKLDLDKVEIRIEPRAEWQQMYNEAWRIVRDYFYDPKVHGQNLAELKKTYAAYLPSVVSRADLNVLFRDMLSNLAISHMAIGGGDAPNAGGEANVGMLGADFNIENNRYRIARIYRGDNSHPLLMSPLTQPGVNVREGEYLISVDGKEITADENLYSYFQGKARRPAQIKVGSKPDGSDARTVTVVPLLGENTLRSFAWTEQNRRRVEELSGGKLAYIYLPNTGTPGYQAFNRDYYGQLDKQGLIIDERFNSGGAPADYFIDVLRRAPLSYYAFREGDDLPFPANAMPGPRVMIINEFAGSGGDTLPWMFRQAGLGTLVGQRTYGAGIGGYLSLPELLDGGAISAPNRAFYNPKKGVLDIENNGVAPDIAVEITPADWRAGRDPQLEKAVQVALEALRRSPPVAPKRPQYPSYK